MKAEIKKYLESLDEDIAKEVKIIMIDTFLNGGVHTNTDPTKTCSGCAHTTPNGHCSMVNGVCTWIPDLG